MKDEVNSAADFLARLLLARNVASNVVENFRKKLTNLLMNHYQDHWFPDKPFKGSGYRCIRFHHRVDPIVEKASRSCGLSLDVTRSLFPQELTMWIDPRDVSYRIGDNGSIGVLFGTGAVVDNGSSSELGSTHQQQHQHQSETTLSTCGQQAYGNLHQQFQYHTEMAMVYS
ncbi:hypothetical protein C0Q70_15201 [Pomacea canaliculata]|uniref:Anti-proliferative protein domain-containing protein n=1 Tax=Pomacea canaliculata TaxID=400727 RepID=A0A2T7NU99_POMCA|nr:protein BTG2-like [Pomacea canaliculata]PVD24716.1 hypothetical protein C0Q70_15201 [Pomacea canaliculata]